VSVGKVFEQALAALGLRIPAQHQSQLVTYAEELERWNRTVNLTALRGSALVQRLIAEPCWIGQKLQMSGTLADIGSGNGSPGIPLCVTRDLLRTDLIEARGKRGAFLRHIAKKLDLKGVTVYRARTDELPSVPDPVDWVTLQAVHPTGKTLDSIRKFCQPTTNVVWITSGGRAPRRDAQRISVPGSTTEIWVFRLDQF